MTCKSSNGRFVRCVAAIVILAACGTLVHATPYYGAISVNFSTPVTNPSDAYYAQPSNWNNLDPGFGATTNLLDNTGAAVAGISIQRTAGGEADVASMVGHTGQTLSDGATGNYSYVSGQVGFNGMINSADPFDGGGPTSFTITGIPYSSYDVAIMTGWNENGVAWHLIDGAISGPQNFTDNWVQNTVTGQISGSTFTFTGNPSGTSVYGVQVLNAVPEPALWAPAAAIALIGLRLRRRRA